MTFQPSRKPTDNHDCALYIEPNERGGWSLRFDGDTVEQRIGHYATAEEAVRVAKASCTNVHIIEPKRLPVSDPVTALRPVEEQIRNILTA